MKYKPGPTTSMLALLGCLALVGCGGNDAPATLDVASIPTAEVWVDGTSHGSTPATISLPAGQHDVALRREKFDPYEATLDLEPGGTTNLDAGLLASDPSDPDVVRALAEAYDIQIPEFEAPEVTRGSGRKPAVLVLWPQGDVRLEGLRTYALEATEEFPGDARLIFRRGRRDVLYDEPIDVPRTVKMGLIPESVLEVLKVNQRVTMEIAFENSRQNVKVDFRIVDGRKVERRLEKLVNSRHFKRQDPILQALLINQIFHDNGLYTETLTRSLNTAAENPTSIQPYQLIVQSLRRLDGEGSSLWDVASQVVRGKGLAGGRAGGATGLSSGGPGSGLAGGQPGTGLSGGDPGTGLSDGSAGGPLADLPVRNWTPSLVVPMPGTGGLADGPPSGSAQPGVAQPPGSPEDPSGSTPPVEPGVEVPEETVNPRLTELSREIGQRQDEFATQQEQLGHLEEQAAEALSSAQEAWNTAHDLAQQATEAAQIFRDENPDAPENMIGEQAEALQQQAMEAERLAMGQNHSALEAQQRLNEARAQALATQSQLRELERAAEAARSGAVIPEVPVPAPGETVQPGSGIQFAGVPPEIVDQAMGLLETMQQANGNERAAFDAYRAAGEQVAYLEERAREGNPPSQEEFDAAQQAVEAASMALQQAQQAAAEAQEAVQQNLGLIQEALGSPPLPSEGN
ncbi:MAG: PEGA domain-containing protein [Planctomycetota bacterium]|jgi:hypothetical protein